MIKKIAREVCKLQRLYRVYYEFPLDNYLQRIMKTKNKIREENGNLL
jgi:hypothetical protein